MTLMKQLIHNLLIAVALLGGAVTTPVHANSAIALNEARGSFCWEASGAPLRDLEVTVTRRLYNVCGLRPDMFPVSTGRGWCAVAVNRRLKKIGYGLGWGTRSQAERKALQRAGAGATLVFVVQDQGNRQLRWTECRLW